MTKFLKNYYFPVFFVFTIMAEMFYHAFMISANMQEKPGQVQYVFILIFVLSLLLLFSDLKVKKYNSGYRQLLSIALIITLLFWLTQFFYSSGRNQNYITYFLSYGVKSIPAMIIGAHFMINNPMERVNKILPYMILPTGFIIGSVGLVVAMSNTYVGSSGDDSGTGMNYQILSYYMAELYAYCAYFIFYSDRSSRIYKFWRFCMIIAMFFFAAICFISGGRGAMAFIIAISVYIIYSLNKTKRLTRAQILLVIMGVAIVFIYIFIKLDISNSIGFNRVINSFADDDERVNVRHLAIQSFLKSPIWGHGIGSIWWEVGAYSHNMFLDLLVETGLIGTFFILFVLYKKTIRLIKLCYLDNSFFFVLFMFSRMLLTTMVSGYWISAYQLWIVFGMMTILSKKQFIKYMNNCKLLNTNYLYKELN